MHRQLYRITIKTITSLDFWDKAQTRSEARPNVTYLIIQAFGYWGTEISQVGLKMPIYYLLIEDIDLNERGKTQIENEGQRLIDA